MGPSTSPVILIVDDFSDALEMYQEYLVFKGYQTAIARSGEEAVTVAKAVRPAVIFMDLRMPHLTGAETLHVLRSDPTFDEIPVVALTAHALADERATAILEGFDEVISKPCLPQDLLAAIDRLLIDGRAAH
jgi:CheY-like chemotaxis protein